MQVSIEQMCGYPDEQAEQNPEQAFCSCVLDIILKRPTIVREVDNMPTVAAGVYLCLLRDPRVAFRATLDRQRAGRLFRTCHLEVDQWNYHQLSDASFD